MAVIASFHSVGSKPCPLGRVKSDLSVAPGIGRQVNCSRVGIMDPTNGTGSRY